MPSLSLQEIIHLVHPDAVVGYREQSIEHVACHPADCGKQTLFVCMDEFLEYNQWQTSRAHLEWLNSHPPAALLTAEAIPGWSLPQIICAHPREALGRIAKALAGNPDESIALVGVTGTNGKTSTTLLLAHLIGALEGRASALGTLGWRSEGGDNLELGQYTTPLAPELWRVLKNSVERGDRMLAMEVSSHALALDRVAGANFSAAILTNFQRDHLDFHGSLEAYQSAKMQLFERLDSESFAILNADDAAFERFKQAAKGNLFTFGMGQSKVDLWARNIQLEPTRTRFEVLYQGHSCEMESALVGRFQVENILAALSFALTRGHALEDLAKALLQFPPVPGRMERHPMPNGSVALVDYAHNPDGLRALLENCRALKPRAIRLVFGCGGDRDRGKRAIMGQLGEAGADYCLLTSDNPRTEDPHQIFNDILEGFSPAGQPQVIADRAQAIRTAYANSQEGDLIVIAGKGHEDYQIIGHQKLPYSDQAVLQQIISES